MKKTIVLIIFGCLFMLSTFASQAAAAVDIYFAQGATGANDGSSCANARAMSTHAAADDATGNTLHLCGTITGASGATGFTFMGGNVTLVFETGAKLSSPSWGAAVLSIGKSNIMVDGGANGIIENTLAGSSGASCTGGTCSVQDPSCGAFNAAVCSFVSISGGSNIEVKNLHLNNAYIHTGTGGDGGQSDGIYFQPATTSNVSVHDNAITNAHAAILFSYSALSAVQVYNNTTSNHTWGVAFLDNDPSTSATGIQVHDNDISGFENWQGPNGGDNGFHQDGIFFAATNNGASFTASSIYNNFIHGAMTNPSTGHIYLSGSSCQMSNISIFNNILYALPNTVGHTPTNDMEALIVLGFCSSSSVYNNTLVSTNDGIDIRDAGTTVSAIKNNIFSGTSAGPMYTAILNKNSSSLSGGKVDNNNYFNLRAASSWVRGDGVSYYSSLTAWQAACGCDSVSAVGDPKLDSNYHTTSGSAALGLGANFSSLGLATLNFDKSGMPRPASGVWTAGAYQSSSLTTSAPPAPTALTAVPH